MGERGNGGFYYLHTNGDLIHKKFEPEADSPFVRKIWPLDTLDRSVAWTIALEALSLGARVERIKELALKWGLDYRDFLEMIIRVKPTPDMVSGLKLFIKNIFQEEEETFWEKVKKESHK